MSIKNDNKLLDLLIIDLKDQKGIYKPGPYWDGYASRIVKAIKKQGLQSFRANPRIGKGFSDSLVFEPIDLSKLISIKSRVYERLVNNHIISKYFLSPFRERIKAISVQREMYMNLYYNHLLSDWYEKFKSSHKLPNPYLQEPTDVITLSGDKIGRTYLNSYLRIYNYSHQINFNSKKNLFEIGGGFGSNVHTLLTMYPNIKKVIYLDIPPILYVANQYLESIFPGSVVSYEKTKYYDSIKFKKDDSLEIFCVAPWQIEKLDVSIDLFWNSASFQEMPESTVQNYCKHLGRICGDNASFCVYIYNTIDSLKTIDQDKLIQLIMRELSRDFIEVNQILEVNKGKYFLG